ncbi:MAG: acyl-[acyl-carrier-protein] thioesterase [Lachnospiraceae bacterium]|nr:acyl-[acyl-carrier-protein] thioesterase [Lachnospiraceae bacterium]
MFKFESKVRFSEVEEDGNLGLKGIINYFQDTSELQSEELGCGHDDNSEENYFWVLNSWQIQIHKRPHLGDTIYAGTAPHSFKGIEGARNFFILDENQEVVVNANSIWSLMDVEKMRPMRIPEIFLTRYKTDEAYPMEYAPRKIDIRSLTEECWSEVLSFTVEPYMLDMNHHMNNAQYVVVASGHLPEDFSYNQLRAEYRKSAVVNDKLLVSNALIEGTLYQKITDAEGNIYTVLEYTTI